MEYQFSEEVDPSTFDAHGLLDGIPLRINKSSAKETKGSLRAQKDWSDNVKPVTGYKGGLADRFSFISVAVPECRPERLEAISYANEYAFLYDGAPARPASARTTEELTL